MHVLAKTVACLAFAGLSAVALDREMVDQLVQSARNIEQDAFAVSAAVKNKKMDPDEVKQKIDAMSADLTKLQELVAQFEASNPQLSERDKQEWQLLKDKVQLLAIFHGQKKRLASEDYVKNRTMIRAHAEGVAKRAQKLQETASKLRRDPVS